MTRVAVGSTRGCGAVGAWPPPPASGFVRRAGNLAVEVLLRLGELRHLLLVKVPLLGPASHHLEGPSLACVDRPGVLGDHEEPSTGDSGRAGDEVSRRVVGDAAGHLADGGHATILCEWLLREGEDWRDVPRGWVAGRGCDTLALHYRTSDPEEYAASWNDGLRNRDPDDYVETVERWADYQCSLGAAGVSTGALVLRRAGARTPWLPTEEMPAGPSGAAGDQLLRLFAAQLAMPASPKELLEARLELVPGQALRQLLAYDKAGWQTRDAEMGIEPGIGISATIPAPIVHVLLSLDGERPLGAVIEQAAAELAAEPKSLRDATLGVARRLLELGLASV